ncbi:MAG: hypothetical protein ABSC95_10295 [Acetobacteraceae bacterium]|jgi:hypothetical protein
MNRITKGLAIAASLAAIGGIGLAAVAQPVGPGYGPPGWMWGHMGPGMMGGGPGMMGWQDGVGPRGFADPAARLTALKTDLAIRPEQTAAWDTYAKVVQDTAATMQAARAKLDPSTLQTMSWQDRRAAMTGLHEQHAQAFDAIKTAADALLPTLDNAQKTVARAALPGLAAGGPWMMAQHGGIPMMGYGMGMMPGPRGGSDR